MIRIVADENHFIFIEEWEDEAAIKIHNASAHFTKIAPMLGELAAKPGSCCLYKKSDFNSGADQKRFQCAWMGLLI